MIEITRPVLEFLRKVEDERKKHEDGDVQDNPLARAIAGASAAGISDLPARSVFVAPQPPPPPPGPRMETIAYKKPVEQIDRAKELLCVSTNKKVGEKTFDYYLKYEGGADGK
jgi:hypothetical protein